MAVSGSAELRARARSFYHRLDFQRPVSFGGEDVADSWPESMYVPSIHGEAGKHDPIDELARQIDWEESAGSYLFTGGRGTGKTTELLRLARQLRDMGHEVFYADLAEYLPLTQPLEVSDFLIASLGSFSDAVSARFGGDLTYRSFFSRLGELLRTRVVPKEVALKLPWPGTDLEFKAALQGNPSFLAALQQGARGVIPELVRQAQAFAEEVVVKIREYRAKPELKVVLLLDSVERLQSGDPDQALAVFKSAEVLFSDGAAHLHMPQLGVVYTVPPYLSALAGAIGQHYTGGRIYCIPSIHVYEGRPSEGDWPAPSPIGLSKMRAIVERRFDGYRDFFSDAQIDRLARSSGGDLRDFLRMLRLAVVKATDELPLGDDAIASAESAIRNDMMPVANDDLAWLARIATSHRAELDEREQLPRFARMQQSKYVLQYRNEQDWYAVHPLLREEVERAQSRSP